MRETVAGEYVVARAPPPPGRTRLADRPLAARSRVVWGEHCSECDYPHCYSSCAFYEPRPDLHCRRFVAGIEDVGRGMMRIRFRKWGKLEGRGPAAIQHWAKAEQVERRHAFAARALANAPLTFRVRRSLAWRLDKLASQPSTSRDEIIPDAFVLAGWSNDGRERPFTLTFLQDAAEADGRPGTFQAHVVFGPERRRFVEPIASIGAAVRLDRPYLIQIEPVGEAEGVDVTVAFADFVAFGDGGGEAWVGASAAPPPRRRPATPLGRPSEPLAKVLVWDLDETLWRGTLAEDGPAGVVPRPEAVAALVELDRRGVLHSVASKNDPDEAKAALSRYGLLDYFLHPQAGWGPKSASVAAIAAALDLGLDSFVFIDDQPFERGEVASAHPTVRTLAETDVAGLTDHPWFAHPATAEAARRRGLYRAEAARGKAAEAAGGDYLAFLRSSELVLTLKPLDAADVTRIHELSQRTNQLNFTGAKLSLPEAEALAAPTPGRLRLTLRCADVWGDYGLIGFVDLDVAAGELSAFFMSCRVQRKRVEQAAFAAMAACLAEAGHKVFRVRFRATERNAAGARMLAELGFVADGESFVRPLDRPFEDADVVRVTEAVAPATAEPTAAAAERDEEGV